MVVLRIIVELVAMCHGGSVGLHYRLGWPMWMCRALSWLVSLTVEFDQQEMCACDDEPESLKLLKQTGMCVNNNNSHPCMARAEIITDSVNYSLLSLTP